MRMFRPVGSTSTPPPTNPPKSGCSGSGAPPGTPREPPCNGTAAKMQALPASIFNYSGFNSLRASLNPDKIVLYVVKVFVSSSPNTNKVPLVYCDNKLELSLSSCVVLII